MLIEENLKIEKGFLRSKHNPNSATWRFLLRTQVWFSVYAHTHTFVKIMFLISHSTYFYFTFLV